MNEDIPDDEEFSSTKMEDYIRTYEELDLKEDLERGIYSFGFEKPSEIQQRAIRPLLLGRDLIIVDDNSKTGKITALSIGILQKVDYNITECQALILAPTHEFVDQITKIISSLGEFMFLKVCGCVNIGSSIQNLQDGVQIVVGTPNRLCDLISRPRTLKVEAVKLFVLDGFDEMLSRDNRDQIFEILNLLSKDVQRVISSATMPPEVMEVARELTRDPVRMIFKSTKSPPFDRVVQYYIPYESEDDKFVALNDLLSRLPSGPVIIYCNSYGSVDSLAQKMQARQITVFTLHNQMTHQERNEIVRRHRLGEAGLLIMTDFRAHGFDVRYSSAVINYEMPRDRDYYLHRINIPIEDGKKGLCFSFIQSTEIQSISDLEEYYHTEIKEVPADLATSGLL